MKSEVKISDMEISQIDNSEIESSIPFLTAVALNRLSISDLKVGDINNAYLVETFGVTTINAKTISITQSNFDAEGRPMKNVGLLVLNANYITLSELDWNNIQSTMSLISVEALKKQNCKVKIFDSTFYKNIIKISSETQKDTSIIAINGELNGHVNLTNLSFIDNEFHVMDIPTSGFYIAPNIVIRTQTVNVLMENTKFIGTKLNILIDDFNTKDAKVSGFSTLFASNIWLFVNSLRISNSKFVDSSPLLLLSSFYTRSDWQWSHVEIRDRLRGDWRRDETDCQYRGSHQ